MKKLVPILTLVLATLIATPAADARSRCSRSYVSHHRSCGGPAWIETYLAYYDHCGRPVYRTRVIPVHPPHRRPYYPVRRDRGCR
jgi:hypothetical protein